MNPKAYAVRVRGEAKDKCPVNSKATFAVAESYVIHRERLATRAADYDPFVPSRIEGGRALFAADYMAMLRDRTALLRAMDARLSDFDALVLPKHDGFRIIAHKTGAQVRLYSRSGNDG